MSKSENLVLRRNQPNKQTLPWPNLNPSIQNHLLMVHQLNDPWNFQIRKWEQVKSEWSILISSTLNHLTEACKLNNLIFNRVLCYEGNHLFENLKPKIYIKLKKRLTDRLLIKHQQANQDLKFRRIKQTENFESLQKDKCQILLYTREKHKIHQNRGINT